MFNSCESLQSLDEMSSESGGSSFTSAEGSEMGEGNQGYGISGIDRDFGSGGFGMDEGNQGNGFGGIGRGVGSVWKERLTRDEIARYLEERSLRREIRSARRHEIRRLTRQNINDDIIGCSTYIRYFTRRISVSIRIKMRFMYRLCGLCCFSGAEISNLDGNDDPRCYYYQVSNDQMRHVFVLQ